MDAVTQLSEVDVLRMQVTRLLARVAAKDAEFSKERSVMKARIAVLEREIKELRRAQRIAA